MITAINPATGETIKTYEEMTLDETTDAVEQAYQAFLIWRRAGFDERAALMKAAARVLLKNKREYARSMALEMGKPVVDESYRTTASRSLSI
jgi:succinate-semialdehyde dehydrogenase/glutarate-semialdehyde dehydrogenase